MCYRRNISTHNKFYADFSLFLILFFKCFVKKLIWEMLTFNLCIIHWLRISNNLLFIFFFLKPDISYLQTPYYIFFKFFISIDKLIYWYLINLLLWQAKSLLPVSFYFTEMRWGRKMQSFDGTPKPVRNFMCLVKALLFTFKYCFNLELKIFFLSYLHTYFSFLVYFLL